MEVMVHYGLLALAGGHEIIINRSIAIGKQPELYSKLIGHPRITLTESMFGYPADVAFFPPDNIAEASESSRGKLVHALPDIDFFARPNEFARHEQSTGYRHVMASIAYQIKLHFPDYQLPAPGREWFQDFTQGAHFKDGTHPFPPENYVVIQTSTGCEAKTSPESVWYNLAEKLIEAGENVIFLGTENKMGFDFFCADYPRRAKNLVGGADLATSLGCVQDAKAVFSGDTGIAHFASANGIPTIALFGGLTDSTVGGPYYHPNLTVQTSDIPPQCNPTILMAKFRQAIQPAPL